MIALLRTQILLTPKKKKKEEIEIEIVCSMVMEVQITMETCTG